MEQSSKKSTGFASQVCTNCKARKRKCNKALPSCALCTKLLLKCQYGHSNDLQKTVKVPYTESWSPNGAALLYASELPDWHASAIFLASFSSRYQPGNNLQDAATLRAEISNEIFTILTAAGGSIPLVTAAYFRSIALWLPIIDQERFLRRLETVHLETSSELALLVLVMHVVVQLPDPTASKEHMQTPTYFTAKSLLSAFVSSGNPSVDLIQAYTLMTVYEFGHGMIEAAQISISICARLITKHITTLIDVPDVSNSEVGLLYWGIVVIDRFMNLCMPSREVHLAMSQNIIDLPSEENEWSQHSTPRSDSTEFPQPNMTQFHLLARAGNLLGKLLEHLSIPRAKDRRLDLDDNMRLDDALRGLEKSLLYQATNGWEDCSAAIALSLSAILTWYKSLFDSAIEDELKGASPDSRTKTATIGIKSSIKIITDITHHFNALPIFHPAIPLPAIMSLYQSACLNVQFAEAELGGLDWKADMDSIRTSMFTFRRRWCMGDVYLRNIDACIDHEVRAHANLSFDETKCIK